MTEHTSTSLHDLVRQRFQVSECIDVGGETQGDREGLHLVERLHMLTPMEGGETQGDRKGLHPTSTHPSPLQ